MSSFTPTNAASSGVTLDRKALKAIARRSDRPGLVYLAQWDDLRTYPMKVEDGTVYIRI